MKSKPNYCTFWFEGPWTPCCYTHDIESILAQEYKSASMRLEADQKLRDCVESKGYTINAKLMYVGVRAWYWSKWYMIDKIKFKEI